jgi:hypothetical protein
MREDFLISMDTMFPNGYVLVYTQKTGDIRLALFNPHGDKTIDEIHESLREEKEND